VIVDKIKKYGFYIVLSSFLLINPFLVDQPLLFKRSFLLVLFLITVVLSFFNKNKIGIIVRYFIHLNNDDAARKISGAISLFSWVLLSFSLFLLNMECVWLARWLFLFFIITVIIGGAFVFYDLWRVNDIIINKFKPLFFGGVPMLYFFTSAYASSYFLQFSNMDISDSPLLELGWKSAFFALWFFVILQPISYGFFMYVSHKFKDHKATNGLGILLLTSFLSLAVLHWANNFLVVSLDWATNNEWHTNASCGSLNISNPTERYFGFNADKYTVYFSNRDGNWGFEEINCIKDDKNQDAFKRVLVSQSKMPKWFKE